jgi:hypothetical protein
VRCGEFSGIKELLGQLTRRDNVRCPPERTRLMCCTATVVFWQGAMTLKVGMQLLEGTWVDLKKPLAIMRKVAAPDEPATSYDAVGVVRRKLLFNLRPTPLTRPTDEAKRAKVAGEDAEGAAAAAPP